MNTTEPSEYLNLFKEELENVGKLVETPNLIREVAISGIESILKQELTYQVRKKLENTKDILENIRDSSIKENYKVIYTQMGILAVSNLEATLKRYFRDEISKVDTINKEHDKLREIRVNALDLINHDLDYSEAFGDLILEKENNSFQNLKLIKETFENYLSKTIILSEENEKLLIYYLELRHVIVHRSGKIDDRFVNATQKMDANIGNYKLGDTVVLDESDWTKMKVVFTGLIKTVINL